MDFSLYKHNLIIWCVMKKENRKYQLLREEMVKKHIEARGINDPLVLQAMRTVPRHYFVNEAFIDRAYSDSSLPIPEHQTISQPYIVAEMTQALELKKEDRVLEVGTGSGYQSAILSLIVSKVYTIERIHPLLKEARKRFDVFRYYNIVTKYSDGTSGWKEEAPFDAIIVTAGAPEISIALVNQLAIGGRMIIPVGDLYTQELVKLYRDKNGIHKTNLGGCKFVKLIGEHGWRE